MAVIEMNWQPTRRDLRTFAVIQLVAAGIVAWVLHRRLDWNGAAIGLVTASAVAMAAGLAAPHWLRVPFVLWMLAAFPVGWVLSHALLAAVYYGIVTPIGLVLRIRGRDALQIRQRPDVSSFWVERPPLPPPARYFRQF